MMTTIKPLISMTLAFILALPMPTRAANGPYLREQQIALAKDIAQNLIAYLQQGQTDITVLRQWLANHPTASKPTIVYCRLFPKDLNCLFNFAIPLMHRRMRLNLALSFAPQTSGYDLGLLSGAGNPYLFLPPGSPFENRPEPLTNDERVLAQEELDLLWDGTWIDPAEVEVLEALLGHNIEPEIMGIIDCYIKILQEKSKSTQNNPVIQSVIIQNLRELQATRKLKIPRLRIQAALLVADPGLKAYAQSRLHIARNLMMTELWQLTDQFRFFVYLSQANPSFADIDKALARSLLDNQKFLVKVQTAESKVANFTFLNPVDTHGEIREQKLQAAESLIWLLGNHSFVEQSLKQHPEWRQAAESLRTEIDKDDRTRSILIATALVAPLILMISPIALALGTVGGFVIGTGATLAAVHMTIASGVKYQQVYERYMARWTPTAINGPLETELDVRQAYQYALVSSLLLGLSLGLPLMSARSFKSLWTAPSH